MMALSDGKKETRNALKTFGIDAETRAEILV
jgi:hypothetical protein